MRLGSGIEEGEGGGGKIFPAAQGWTNRALVAHEQLDV